MSAITGIFHFNDEPVSIEHGKELMKALQIYPADDVQAWFKENIFLGCHAQWITPESIGEKLPYYDYERQLVITADAIIDNREELFESLQIKRDLRNTIPDSKLILLAYEKWGEEAPKYLLGEFAFIIWDEKNQKLFGARDFSGARTLYYFNNSKQFAFCTVIKPLLSLPFIEKKLNEQWLAEYLAINGMFETIEPFSTVYKHIDQLPPAHTISINKGKIKLSKYMKVTTGEQLKLKSNFEYEEAFRDVFNKAVVARVRTNRKVGAHLSGGLDSGSVVSFAAKALQQENKKLYTFSYIPVEDFKDWTPKYRMADERPFIQSTVQHVGNIKDTYLDFNGKSPFSEVDDWLTTYEMPYKFFENSFWVKGVYEKAYEEGIGILLNGSRGNWSISWGPALDYQAMLLKRFNLIKFYRELTDYSKNIGVNKGRVLSVVRKKAFSFLNHTKTIKSDGLDTIINPDLAKRTAVFERLNEHGVDLGLTTVPNAYDERKKHFESLTFWSGNGAVNTKLSLRFKLWNRDPTNDLRVIRFTLSVPEEQFVQNGMDRSLVRRSTANYLPDNVRLNQKVRGVQGSDGVHRMSSNWKKFTDEISELASDPVISDFLNIQSINNALLRIKEVPKPEYVFHYDFKMLMRSLIVYRFIKNFT